MSNPGKKVNEPELLSLVELRGNTIFKLKILLKSITKVLDNNYVNFLCGANNIIIFGKSQSNSELIHLKLEGDFFDDYFIDDELKFAIEPKQLAKILERPSKADTLLKIGFITQKERFSCIYEDENDDKISSFELPLFIYDEEGTFSYINKALNMPLETFIFFATCKNALDIPFKDQKYVVFNQESAVFELFTQPEIGQITITTARTEIDNPKARTEISMSNEGLLLDIQGKESKAEYNYLTINHLEQLNNLMFKTTYNYGNDNILRTTFNLEDEGNCIFSLIFVPVIDEAEEE